MCEIFTYGKILEGITGIVDSYGTMEQNEESFYDVEAGEITYAYQLEKEINEIFIQLFEKPLG